LVCINFFIAEPHAIRLNPLLIADERPSQALINLFLSGTTGNQVSKYAP